MTTTFPLLAQQLVVLAQHLDDASNDWRCAYEYECAISSLLKEAVAQGAFQAEPRLRMLIAYGHSPGASLGLVVRHWFRVWEHPLETRWPLPWPQATRFVLGYLIAWLETGAPGPRLPGELRWQRKQRLRGRYRREDFRPLAEGPTLPAECRSLADALAAPQQVRRLFLRDQHLHALPPQIATLTRLQHLTVDVNVLTQLPDELGELAELRSLEVSRNRLSTLPDSLGGLLSLEYLSAWGNRLTALPDTIGELRQLRRLILFGNQLTTLPTTLANLTNLVELRLNGNPLKEFPFALLCALPALEVFSWSSPTEQMFPEGMAELRRIKRLRLYGRFSGEVRQQLREQLPQAMIEEIWM
jgi:hypothetical protein